LITVAAVYIDATISVVALFAKRHFSAGAWTLLGLMAVVLTYVAVSAWRELARRRRQPSVQP
jgi:membrane protein implicated in regulation of membrane protease activity